MRLIDLLQNGSEFSCELITHHWETNYSFEWDSNIKITDAGFKRFEKVLQSEAKMTKNGNIELQDDSITEQELEAFTASVAGYCPQSKFNEWFLIGKEDIHKNPKHASTEEYFMRDDNYHCVVCGKIKDYSDDVCMGDEE